MSLSPFFIWSSAGRLPAQLAASSGCLNMCKVLYTRIIASIAELTMLIRSDVFVGEYNSNVGRLVHMFGLRVNKIE